jgi:hypothetical protein
MNLLQIVLTNTSTLDTSLPALWYLRQQHPDAQITILYCVSNRSQVLRDATFFDDFCQANRITQLDLADLLRGPRLARSLWRKIFATSANDAFPLLGLLKSPRLIFGGAAAHIATGLRKKLEAALGEWLVDSKALSGLLDPDVVLFDLREKTQFYGRLSIFNQLYERRPLTFLMPHAPHNITSHQDVTSFDEDGEYFPSFCRYWIPFKHSTAWELIPERAADFIELGYPAFDSAWMDYLRTLNKRRSTTKQCLVLLRNFFGEDQPTPDGERFTVPYQDTVRFVNRLATASRELGDPVEFIIKPHPKASRLRMTELLRSTRLTNWTISYEPFYKQLTEIDLVVSPYTTSLLITQMFGIPSILVEDELQAYVNRWDVLEKMYTELSLYCRETDTLALHMQRGLTDYDAAKDIAHLRQYFPDHNLTMIDAAVRGRDAKN